MDEAVKVHYFNLENFLEMKKILESNGFKCTQVTTVGLEVTGEFVPVQKPIHPGEADETEEAAERRAKDEWRKENRKLAGL